MNDLNTILYNLVGIQQDLKSINILLSEMEEFLDLSRRENAQAFFSVILRQLNSLQTDMNKQLDKMDEVLTTT